MGCLLAYELANQGATVTLLERGHLMKEASWAGGGIISPLYPWRYPTPIATLAREAQYQYPVLLNQLRELTGIDCEYERSGLLLLDTKESLLALRWAKQFNHRLHVLTPPAIRQLQPELIDYASALWLPDVAQLRNPRLRTALITALQQKNHITIHENTALNYFETDSSQITRVKTSTQSFTADHYILCTGAWSQACLSTLQLSLPIFPVRGQMIAFSAKPGWLTKIILYRNHYLIPRRDGLILVGSTLESVGFDQRTTQAGYDTLYAAAIALLPDLQQYPVTHHWAGLRPGSPQGLPFMGQIPTFRNLWINAGHFRNGLLLAPSACQLMRTLLLKQTPTLDPTPFSPFATNLMSIPST